MRWFLIVYTLLYLFLEIAFRARLLDAIGSVSDALTLESIEIIGRLIASLGFSVLVISKFNLGKTKIRKVAYKTTAYLLSFVMFFYAQKLLVEYFVSVIPDDFKKNSLALSLYKENLFYKKNYIEGVTDTNDSSTNEKVFLATLPIVNISNEVHLKLLDDNKKELFGTNILAKIENADHNLAIIEWQKVSYEIRKIWNKYKRATQSNDEYKKIELNNHLKKAKDVYRAFDFRVSYAFLRYRKNILNILSSNDTSSFLLSTFDSYGNFFKKEHKFEVSYKYPPYLARSESNLLNVDFESSTYDSSEFINKFNEGLNRLLKNDVESLLISANHHRKSVFGNEASSWKNVFSTYSENIDQLTKNICVELNSLPSFNDEKSIKLIANMSKDIKYGLVIGGTKTNKRLLNLVEIKNDSINSNFMSCNTSTVEQSLRKALGGLATKANKMFYGFDRDYNSTEYYVKSNFGRTEVQVELSKQNIVVPKTFYAGDYEAFLKYYKKSIINGKQIKLNRAMAALANLSVASYTKRYGDFPNNLNEYEFYRTPAVQTFLKNTFPHMIQKNGYIMMDYHTGDYYKKFKYDLNDVMKDFIEKREKYRGVYLYDLYRGEIENKEMIDNYAKSIVVPTFVLFISTIMIIFNIINLVLLLLNPKSVRNKSIVIASVFFLFLITSYFNDNHKYTAYYRSIEGQTSKSIVMLAKLLQNTNILFDYMGFSNDLINRQIDVFERKHVINKIDGNQLLKSHRIFMRNKNK